MSDRWDVIVSGVADRTPHGLWRVATEVSRGSGIDPNVVFQAISLGPVIIAAGMGAAEAAEIEEQLSAVGARIELRPTGTSGGTPVLGAAPGGTDVGHAPHQGAAQGTTGVGHAPHGSGALYSALAQAASNLDASELSALDGSTVDEQAGSGPPARAAGAQGTEMDARFGTDLSTASSPAAPPPQPDHQQVAAGPGAGEADLELDLDVAGMKKKKRSAVPEVEPEPEASVPARVVASPAPTPTVRLLGSDPLTVGLLAAAIGLGAGLLPAMRAASKIEHEEIAPKYEEMEVSIQRPLAVRAGKLPAPSEIASSIEERAKAARSRFLITWIAFAAPIGLVLGFLKRPGG